MYFSFSNGETFQYFSNLYIKAVAYFPTQKASSAFRKWKIQFLPHPAGASLMVQKVKSLPAVRETQVQSLGEEDPLEKRMATHPSILAWSIPWTEEPGGLQSTGCKDSDMTERPTHTHTPYPGRWQSHLELQPSSNISEFLELLRLFQVTIALQQFVIYTQVVHFITEPEMVDKEKNCCGISQIFLWQLRW